MSKKILSSFLILFLSLCIFANTQTAEYATAFSSILTEMNQFDVTAFNHGESAAERCRFILKDSWEITNYEQLIAQVTDLTVSGQNKSYMFLAELIDKNKGLSPIEIIKKECLNSYEGVRLFYVCNVKDRLGFAGIEAWDYARSLNLLRWGISAGYITEEEALQLSEAIVDYLIQVYATWDDFFAHYVAGRQFFSVTDGKAKEYAQAAVDSCKKVMKKIDFENLPLSGTPETALLKFDDPSLLYEPSKDAKQWYEVHLLYKNRSDKNAAKTYSKLGDIKKKYPEYADIPFVEYFDAILTSSQKRSSDIWRCTLIYDKLKKQLEGIPNDRALAKSIHIDFARINLALNSPEKALACLAALPEEISSTGYFQMLKGVSYLYLIGTSPDFEVNANYESNAYEALSNAESQEYPLSDSTLQWMREYERKRDSN